MPDHKPSENNTHSFSEACPSDQTGKVISHYRIVEKLGGGMSVVYKARDIKLDRDVVLKFLPHDMLEDPRAKRRFEREARAASGLKHTNVCTVYDFDEHNGEPFIVMEFFEGETLKERIKRGPVDPIGILQIGRQIADALASAHDKGIIHRDIKPGNIFLTKDGQAKLLDFGIAKRISREVARTGSNGETLEFEAKDDAALTDALIGTLAYMSPEQAQGKKIDERSDLFSLGIVIYEMACGVRPFAGANTHAILGSIVNDDPVPLTVRNSQIPIGLETITQAALQKDPNLRYQSARNMQSDLLCVQGAIERNLKDVLPAEAPQRGFEIRVTKFVKYTMVIIGVLLAAFLGFRYFRHQESLKAPGIRTRSTSIAVLPFEDLSEQKDNQYFCDGISEELINALSKVKTLRVAARTSAFAFRERKWDIREIGQKLNADSIMEGSVRRTGEQVRVDVSLVNSRDGYTVWSRRFDLQMRNIFDVQEQIAQSIVDALEVRSPEYRQLMHSTTRSAEAYKLFLQGRFRWSTRTPAGLQESIRYYSQAVAIDPDYALAYAAMADSYYDLAEYGVVPGRIVMPKAKASALKATEIDPQVAVAHATLGLTLAAFDYDWKNAGLELRKAVELNPGSAPVHHWYGLYLSWVGSFDEALNEINVAIKLDPLSANVGRALGTVYVYSRQPDKAIRELKDMSGISPEFFGWHVGLGDAYLQKGNLASAIESLEKAKSLSGNSPLVSGLLGYAYGRNRNFTAVEKIRREFISSEGKAYVPSLSYLLLELGLENRERSLELLERSYEERSPLMAWSKVDPKLDFLRSDPKFIKFLNKLNFPK